MIGIICVGVACALAGAAGGLLIGSIHCVGKLADTEGQHDELKRRLNRILETERPDVEPHPKLAMIYEFAKGVRV